MQCSGGPIATRAASSPGSRLSSELNTSRTMRSASLRVSVTSSHIVAVRCAYPAGSRPHATWWPSNRARASANLTGVVLHAEAIHPSAVAASACSRRSEPQLPNHTSGARAGSGSSRTSVTSWNLPTGAGSTRTSARTDTTASSTLAHRCSCVRIV